MSTATRNPAGHGEDVTVLTIFFSLGVYLSGLVDDPSLGNFILGLTTLAGQILSTVLRNWLGAPLASLVGAGVMKGARVGVILLALGLPLGCSVQVGPQGFSGNLGQSSVSICKGDPPSCTVIEGAPVSEQASNVIGGFLAGALRMLGLSYGVPTVPAPDTVPTD